MFLNCLSYLEISSKVLLPFQISLLPLIELYIPNLGQKVTASDDMDGRRNVGEDPALLVCHLIYLSQESIKIYRAKKNTTLFGS